MNRKEKIKTFIQYRDTKCVCGNAKKAYRWVCLSCKDKIGQSQELSDLDKACQSHVLHAQKVLNLCRK